MNKGSWSCHSLLFLRWRWWMQLARTRPLNGCCHFCALGVWHDYAVCNILISWPGCLTKLGKAESGLALSLAVPTATWIRLVYSQRSFILPLYETKTLRKNEGTITSELLYLTERWGSVAEICPVFHHLNHLVSLLPASSIIHHQKLAAVTIPLFE